MRRRLVADDLHYIHSPYQRLCNQSLRLVYQIYLSHKWLKICCMGGDATGAKKWAGSH